MNSSVRYRDEPATGVFSGLGVGSGFYFGCGLGIGKTYGAFYLPPVQLSTGVGCGLQVGFGWGFFLYGWGACVWSLRSMLRLDERDVGRVLKEMRQQNENQSSSLSGEPPTLQRCLSPQWLANLPARRDRAATDRLHLGHVFRWQRHFTRALERAAMNSLLLASPEE
jgi:hypothetical protein